jgi:hypothetical protein
VTYDEQEVTVGTTGGRHGGRGALDAPTTARRLVRSADQLDIVVELFDAEVVDDQVTPTGPDAAMRLTFGSQHTVERTFVDPDPVPPITAVNHIAAGASVVVLPIAAAFPFTVEGVLGAAEGSAGLDGQDAEGTPDGSVTAVEAPTGLWLSPVAPARLVAAREPLTTGDTTEVWAARIEPTAGPAPLDVAAIDHSADELLATQRPGLDARADIGKNSTTDAPLSARRLWLSSSGAFADLHGEWPGGVGIALYDHLMAAGRDVHVEFQSLGYLLPFGHRAAIADVSNRVVLDDEGGGQTAVMQSTTFLVIVDPVVTTPRAGARLEGRGLPFARITASASEATPIELVAVDSDGAEIEGVFDLRVEATDDDLLIDYLAVDRGGNDVSFSLPATFIDDEVAYQTGAGAPPAAAIAVAKADGRVTRREVDLAGQRVTYADPFGAGQAGRATHRFRLSWDGVDGEASEDDLTAARSPAVFGVLESADVVHEMAGSATGATGETVDVTHHDRWLEHGNDVGDNFDLAFLKLGRKVSSLIGGGSAVGGVAQFDLLADVYNQSAGAGLDLDAPGDPWDPAALLGDASKIVGNILLSAVIDLVDDGLPDVPGLDIPGTTVSDDGLTVQFTYCPTLKDLPAVGFRTTDQTRCCVHVTTTASIDDGIEAGFETEMRVENFFLDFPPPLPPLPPTPVVVADVESIVGTISSDGSTSIVPTVRSWDFSGAISMLMALVDKLGLGNVDLKVLGELIDIDSSINVPDIALGVAEIKNFAINLGFELPLGPGDGRLSIGIGSKSSPLDIDVLMFGATFWLDIDLGFNGGSPTPPALTTSMGLSVYWEMLDFDIVVVSISFALRLSADWKLSGGEVTFTGAVSLEGEIDVLGLISVSAALIASLRYESATEVMVLKGTVTYCVDSFLGKLTSGTVPIGETEIELGDGQSTARRALGFPAAGGRSSFSDRYSEPVWADYCDAFA